MIVQYALLTLVSSTEGAKINITLFSSNFATELVIETTPWNIPVVVSFWQVWKDLKKII